MTSPLPDPPGSGSATGRVLVEGRGIGRLLRLRAPISLWGGLDPLSGRIVDPRHPDHGVETAGRVLLLPSTIGSSSSSAIMLELLRNGRAPAAVILGRMDAILTLGVIVAREMGYPTIPVVELDPATIAELPDGTWTSVSRDGTVAPAPEPPSTSLR